MQTKVFIKSKTKEIVCPHKYDSKDGSYSINLQHFHWNKNIITRFVPVFNEHVACFDLCNVTFIWIVSYNL